MICPQESDIGIGDDPSNLKNVQIIDGALNCSYDIFAFTEKEFRVVFPAELQDIEFIEDVIARAGGERLDGMFTAVWQRPVDKKLAHGICGTLFYGLEFKKKYYPTKRSSEMVTGLEPIAS